MHQDMTKLSIGELVSQPISCACGRTHETAVEYVHIGAGVSAMLPEILCKVGKARPFVVCDPNTYEAAGRAVCALLTNAGVEHTLYTLREREPEPDEYSLGQLACHFDGRCDIIVAVGSGVINDLCKMLAMLTGRRSIIVGTAPSMDGFSSNSSSMLVGGVKVTIYDPCPIAILLDTDILVQAPMRMLWAGLGDMLAKYVATCDWRLANLVVGDYYCENIASLMRRAVRTISEQAPRLKSRDPGTIAHVGEGLVMSAITMSFAGTSRPASGLEHYFSHMWDMFCIETGASADLHGIQVGVGTLLSLKIYEWIREIVPDRARAEAFMARFDPNAWEAQIHRIFGSAAPRILEIEAQTHKNDPAKHAARLDILLTHWDDVIRFIDEELPPFERVYDTMKNLGMPMTPQEIGYTPKQTRDAFLGARDIRDKYMCCSLLWDLGLIDSFADRLEAYVAAGCPR